MASQKLGARVLPLLAASALALASGCYARTPHRAQVATQASAKDCSSAVVDVFSRSGFVQIPTPPKLSMFFTARVTGPYTSFLRTGSGVGVTVNPGLGGEGTCHITIEALSPDPSCSETHLAMTCASWTGTETNDLVNDPAVTGSPLSQPAPRAVCPTVPPVMCELSYAPGAANDAAVDELARRVQAALGTHGQVD